MKVAEKYDLESPSDTESSYDMGEVEEVQGRSTRVEDTEVNEAYAALVNEAKCSSNCGPPLLLPAVIQPANKVKVSTEVKDMVEVEHYIKEVEHERDAAFQTVKILRNKVEQLHSDKRKLHYDMNNKIDTVRTFWRNRLVEGDTRSGLFV